MIDDLAKQTKYFLGNPKLKFTSLDLDYLFSDEPTDDERKKIQKLSIEWDIQSGIDQKEDEANLKYAHRRHRTPEEVHQRVIDYCRDHNLRREDCVRNATEVLRRAREGMTHEEKSKLDALYLQYTQQNPKGESSVDETTPSPLE